MSNTSRSERSSRADPLNIKSLEKAALVLDCFSAGRGSLGLAELTRISGLDKSAVQRITYTLRRIGWLEQDPKTRQFRLGRGVLDLTFDYLRANPLVERATPAMLDLRRSTHERVDFSLFDDTEIIYVVRLQSKRETFSATLIGRRMPVFCTSGGRAILAALAPEEARDIVDRSDRKALTKHTVTDPERLLDLVAAVRRNGYALNVEECLPGEIVVGAAVLGDDRRPIGAVHISGSMSEWEPEAFERKMAPLAVAAARALGP